MYNNGFEDGKTETAKPFLFSHPQNQQQQRRRHSERREESLMLQP
jgi:hypothetical protein